MFSIKNPTLAGIVTGILMCLVFFFFLAMFTHVRGPVLFGAAIGVGIFGFFHGRKSAAKRL